VNVKLLYRYAGCNDKDLKKITFLLRYSKKNSHTVVTVHKWLKSNWQAAGCV